MAPSQPGARNLVELLVARAADAARTAALYKVEGRWVEVSWGAVLEQVRRVSAGLVARGVKPGERVALFADTSLQWVVCDLAISAARAITVPIYPSSTADEVRYILGHSGAVLLFVDGDASDGRQAGRLSRVRERLEDCPGLRAVAVFDAGAVKTGGRETPLGALVEEGAALHEAHPQDFAQRVAAVGADDPCCIIYTSGTTGNPKGVVLTHGNWAYEAEAARASGVMAPGDRVMLSLPLAHAFAQAAKAAWLSLGFELAFAESQQALVADLGEVRPTILPSVPRLFEKLYGGVLTRTTSAPGVQGAMGRWAFRQFDGYVEARVRERTEAPLGFGLARRLVFDRRVRPAVDAKLGGRMRLLVSGAAPLSRKVAYFFELIGLPVLEGYGLTETSGGATINPPGRAKFGTVGRPLPGTELRLAPDGEILLRGPGVMRGYLDDPAATLEALEPDGWLHTGDIGELDADGYLRITDRKKDIIVTAGGKNVAPQNIEAELKAFPLVSHAMVYGDRRPYLVALICVAEDAGRRLVAGRGAAVGNYAELSRRPEVREAVQAVVERVNAELPPYATLKHFALMDHDFTQESGELTPTLKVKRKVCTRRYAELLDGLYGGEGTLD